MTPELALRNFIGELLREDAAVAAIVGKKVRDDVPSDADADKLPWICFGPIATRRLETGGCGPAWTVTARVFAESAAFNRDQAWTIARAAIRAVEGQRGPDEAGFCDPLTVSAAGDVVDPGKIKTVFVDVTAMMVDVV